MHLCNKLKLRYYVLKYANDISLQIYGSYPLTISFVCISNAFVLGNSESVHEVHIFGEFRIPVYIAELWLEIRFARK